MKLYKCKKLKSLILIMLIVPILTLSFPKSANAIAGIDDAIAIAGGLIAPEVAIGLLVCGGIACGYEFLDNHKVEVGTFINDTLIPMKNNAINYFKTFTNSKGEKYVGLTEQGLNYSRDEFKKFSSSALIPNKVVKPSAGINTSVPFTQDGFTCMPANKMKNDISMGWFKAGDIITIRLGQYNGSYKDIPLKPFFQDCEVKYCLYTTSPIYHLLITHYVDKIGYYDFDAYDGSNPKQEYVDYLSNYNTGKVCYWGYKVKSDTVYVPGKELIRHTGIEEGVKQGDTVAIPVGSDVIGGQDVFIPSSNNDWTKSKPSDVVYSGLKEAGGSIPGEGAGEGSATNSWVDTITGAIAGVKDAVKSNTKSLVNSIADIFTIPDTAPTLDFSPLMVATRKFPFCIPWDVWNCYKVFEGSADPFKYHFDEIQLSGFVTGGETITVIPSFDLNFADYKQIDIAIKVFKFLELLLFIFMLLKFTRSNFMKG